MTALASEVPKEDFLPGMIGSSVSWSRLAANPTRRSTKPFESEWYAALSRPQISTGVTDGATAVQQCVQQLVNGLREWSMQYPLVLANIEQERAILMSPRREQMVTVHPHDAGRSQPRVSLDDVNVISVRQKNTPLADMESAAATGDERAFLVAKDLIDWETRPAEDFLRAVQLALSAGAHMAARNLAAQGAARHPNDANLQKYARILAPPRVLRSDAPPHPGLRANRDWLMTCGDKYRGQWVALRQGVLLGAADSLAALKELIGDTSNILPTKVF